MFGADEFFVLSDRLPNSFEAANPRNRLFELPPGRRNSREKKGEKKGSGWNGIQLTERS
jgi:hypothetical protein